MKVWLQKGDEIEDKIYILNANNVYEEFKKKEIVESGSNDNGNYIKFSDGTLICHFNKKVTDQAIDTAYGTLFRGVRAWKFPVEFVEVPSVSCGTFRWGTGGSWGTVAAITTTHASLAALDIASRPAGTIVEISATAIGRWKQS